MGEEVKKEEPQAEQKPEEKKEKKSEDKKEEEPKPPAPFMLSLDLHCPGCAKKIERSIMNIRGVEGVVTDMAKNQVTIKGIVDPQAVRAKIMKRTKRTAIFLSPLPSEGEPLPEVVTSQVSGLATVELKVNMHCAACAEQLEKKILKMRGVQTATTEFSTGKVTVTGTMDENMLVDYVYKRTKKQAKIIAQPEPEPEPEQDNIKEEKTKEAKPAEEGKQENEEEKKEEEEKPAEETRKEEKSGGKKEEKAEVGEESKDEQPKKEEGNDNPGEHDHHEENMQRMIHYYQPLYVIERIPPPQIFSDENPNACCIS